MTASVLIVEDDPLTQRTLEQLLAPHGAKLEVRFADSADRARAMFEDRPAQVVVCDLYLPRKDAILLGEELRRRGAQRLLLMAVGHIEAAVRERARQRLGAEIYSKPLELPDLVASLLSERGMPEPPSSDMPQAGSLAERSPAQLLLEMWEERRSGELQLNRGRVRKIVTLHRGAPVAVRSNLRTETLGHFLVQRGVLTEAQHQEALAAAQRDGGRLGRVLVRLGFLTDRALLDELAGQIRHKLVTTLRWPDGESLFTYGQPAGDHLELPFEAPRLVFIGLRRTAHLDEIVPRMLAEPARIILKLRAERHRATIVKVFGAEGLQLLDRRPLVAELMAHRDAAQVLVLCDALLRTGCAELEQLGPGAVATPVRDPLALVELGRDRAARAPTPRSEEGLYVDPDTGPYPRLPPSALDPRQIDPPSDEGSGVFPLPTAPGPMTQDELRALDPNGEALRKEVLAEYLTLHAKDHYQLLGVERTAAAQDIALAHAAMQKKFRFERFAGVELGRDYARLEEIVARLRLAHETLGNAERRAAYDRTLPPPPVARRDGRLDAEVASQEGLQRLQRGDYHGARQKLALAVEADDEQPDYHALLGWATYLTALGPGRESASMERIRQAAILAQPHLDTALTIDPDHTDAHEFQGRIDAARGDDGNAADHLELVLDQAPTRAEALTSLEAALARRGDWHRLEHVYRRLIHRLADDATERPLLVWWRLAELYRTRLQDPEAARVAYERVARLAPDDPRPRRALAELLRTTPASWQEAAQALRETWRLEPEDAAPGLALSASHRDGERWDAALVTAAALVCRGEVDEEAAIFLRQHRPRFLVRAQEVVTPELVDALRHPDDDRDLGALFAEVFAVSAPEVRLQTLGVSVTDAVAAQALPEPFARAMSYVSHVLDVAAPMVFVRGDFGAEMHVGAARPPVLLVGPQALATSDLLVLAFRLGRALSYLWPGRALAGALPTTELKEHLGAALTLAQPGMRFDDPDGRVATLRARLSGRATSLARTLRPHVEAMLADKKTRVHLGRFVTGMARTADRIGLLVCNDLPTAARIVGEECAPGAEDDLIDFAIGEAYLDARAHLGLAIAV